MIKLNYFNLIIQITLFQGIMLAGIFFFRKRGNKLSNRLFAIIVLIYLMNLFSSFTRSNSQFENYLDYHKIIYISLQFAYLVGPLLYLFTKNLIFTSYKIPIKFLYHLVPFAIITTYALFEVATKNQFIIWQSDLYSFNMFAILIQLTIYICLTTKIVLKKRPAIYSYVKQAKDYNLVWIKIIVFGFIVLWFAQLQSFAILLLFKKINWCAYTESVHNAVVFILINFIIIIGLINPKLLEFNKKKKSAGLSVKNINEYAGNISTLIKEDKLYTNPELSISYLSEVLKINKKYVSEIINTAFGKSFIDLINEQRIKESISLLKSNANEVRSIKEIYYDVGFNSRTAFNCAFKKHTGQTPTEFRKQHIEKIYTDS